MGLSQLFSTMALPTAWARGVRAARVAIVSWEKCILAIVDLVGFCLR